MRAWAQRQLVALPPGSECHARLEWLLCAIAEGYNGRVHVNLLRGAITELKPDGDVLEVRRVCAAMAQRRK